MESVISNTGRPRASDSHVLEATGHLVEAEGYDNVTMSMIADFAGVGRQTLFRRWSSKANLVMEAVLTNPYAVVDPDLDAATALSSYLRQIVNFFQAHEGTLRALIAAAQRDDEFNEHFQRRMLQPHTDKIRSILIRAVADGDAAADSDLRIAASVLSETIFAMLSSRRLDASSADIRARTILSLLTRTIQ